MELLIPLVLLLLFILVGVPIGLALAAAGGVGVLLITHDFDIAAEFFGSTPYAKGSDFVLAAIPGFVLMAYLMAGSGLADDTYKAASVWLSRRRGGLGIATTFSCTVFGAMSGASTASAAVMSRVAYPSMKGAGYSPVLSSGVIAVGSTIVTLIPPSVGMVVYALVTGTSLGALLLAGVIPGLLLALLLMVTIWAWVRVRPAHAPAAVRHSWSERLSVLKPIWMTALVVVVLMAILYSGFATPSEVGAVGALLLAAIGILRGRLGLREIGEALGRTLRTTSMIFLIIMGASILGYFMTLSRVPQLVAEAVSEASLNRWVVVGLVCIAYFVASMFMDENPLLLIMLPISFPLVVSLGFDPVWFGIVTMLLVSMGLIFPPVGLNAFIVAAESGVPVHEVYRGTTVLLLPIVLTLIIVMVFPEVVTWLPQVAMDR